MNEQTEKTSLQIPMIAVAAGKTRIYVSTLAEL